MTKIQEGLLYLRGRKVSVDQFRRAFNEMLLMGLESKGYVLRGDWITVTDAGHRLLADTRA